MKYYVEFQPITKGASRPTDDGESSAAHKFETNAQGVALLPNVGDFVHCTGMGDRGNDYVRPSGRVKSRLFTYFGNESCGINIVVEEVSEAEFAALIKE